MLRILCSCVPSQTKPAIRPLRLKYRLIQDRNLFVSATQRSNARLITAILQIWFVAQIESGERFYLIDLRNLDTYRGMIYKYIHILNLCISKVTRDFIYVSRPIFEEFSSLPNSSLPNSSLPISNFPDHGVDQFIVCAFIDNNIRADLAVVDSTVKAKKMVQTWQSLQSQIPRALGRHFLFVFRKI